MIYSIEYILLSLIIGILAAFLGSKCAYTLQSVLKIEKR